MCLTVDISFILTEKINDAKCFFNISNTEIAQCRQELDAILNPCQNKKDQKFVTALVTKSF